MVISLFGVMLFDNKHSKSIKNSVPVIHVGFQVFREKSASSNFFMAFE